jgi:DNA-binding PadR family transcriptional regulator
MANSSRPLGLSALRLLIGLADGERHGYALMQELRSDALGPALGPGALYRTLQQLLSQRLITESAGASSDTSDERRRYYRLTVAGRRAMATEADRMSELVRRAVKKGVVAPARR